MILSNLNSLLKEYLNVLYHCHIPALEHLRKNKLYSLHYTIFIYLPLNICTKNTLSLKKKKTKKKRIHCQASRLF